MHRRALLAPALLGLALLAGCRTPRGTAEAPVVTGLELEGAGSGDAKALKARLATQGPDCVFWFLACDWSRLDPDALATDRRRVEAFYRERGYYHAVVEPPEVTPDGEGRVRVVLRVDAGKPVRVSSVTVEGLEEAPAARAKAGPLAIAPGQVFTEAAYDAAKGQLSAALLSSGWPTGAVTQAARVLPEEGTAEVTYRAEPGPRLRFGRVFVAGTAAVPREKVVAQASREVKAGDWFDVGRLERAQTRVFDLGVFAGVRVNRGEPDEARGTVPVVVAVREAPFHTLRLGPGLGFQASRWEAQGTASWIHRNWLGGLRRLQLDARAGYAWLPDPFSRQREGLVGLLAAELSQPGVLGDAVDLSARVELEKSLEQAYGFVSERVRLGAPLRLAPRWTVAPTYNLEIYQLRDLVGTPSLTLPQLQNCPGRTCLLSYLEQRVIWDGRDDPLDTTHGVYAGLSVQEGFPIGGYGYTFIKVQPEVRVFLPLGRSTVLATRARLGALLPVGEAGNPPVVALFTLGGALSMRGYGAGRLSPMSYQDGRWVPTGGNGLLEGSLELRQALGGSLTGALFLDGGNVSDASSSPSEWRTVVDPTRLQLALGVGLRYRTPFGPLRVDLAGRLPTDWRAGVPFSRRFPAVPGESGHREPLAALHVSLGEAF
jgi:translocation and assembly module TamA